MKTSILLAILLLLTLPSFASTDEEFVSTYMKGREAFNNLDYNSAIVFFEKALQILNIDPVEAGKHHKELKADIEKHPKSKNGSDADRVVGFTKEWLDSYYYLGLAYAYKGDKASALKQVTDLRRIGRDDYADSLDSKIKEYFKEKTASEKEQLAYSGDYKTTNFQGDWWFDGIVNDKIEDYGHTVFHLTLYQQGNKITGWYSSVAYDGNKIDFDPDEKQNISGVVEGNLAIVTFKSYSWNGTGKARIIHKGDRIVWERIAGTEKGLYWCPHKAILTREKIDNNK